MDQLSIACDVKGKDYIKATGTCLWIKLIWHKLARITSPTNKLSNYFKNQPLQKSLRY